MQDKTKQKTLIKQNEIKSKIKQNKKNNHSKAFSLLKDINNKHELTFESLGSVVDLQFQIGSAFIYSLTSFKYF